MYNQPDIPAVAISLFAIKKTKTTKDVLDKKASATYTPAAVAPLL